MKRYTCGVFHLLPAAITLLWMACSPGTATASEDSIQPGDTVVTVFPARLMKGTQVILTVEPRTYLVVTAVRGNWIGVAVDQNGKKVNGWIEKSHLRRVEAKSTSRFAVPPAVEKLLTGKQMRIAWYASELPMKSLPDDWPKYDLLVLEGGDVPADVSREIRQWTEQGGIVWAFDRAFGATWRNKELFGGLVRGADKGWEPPEDVMFLTRGMAVMPHDPDHATAKDVDSVVVAGDHTMIVSRDEPETVWVGLTRFDRNAYPEIIALLKAQEYGRAVIGDQNFQAGAWITIGFARPFGKGMIVILPSLDYDKGATARFTANLAEWCAAQVAKGQ